MIDSVEVVSPESVYVIDDVEGQTEVTLVTVLTTTQHKGLL